MSIVEKAVEKLRTLQPPQEAVRPRIEPALEPAVAHVAPAPTVERLQDRVHVMHAAMEEAPVWHINPADLKREGLIPAEEEAAHRLADELRRIKRPLLANVAAKGAKALENGHRIMVASAIPGEGKTFTSLNLAMSLAKELDFEVLLVDGDIPKSDITRILRLESRPGLIDVLMDEKRQPAEVIVRTDVPNLLVVPAGQRSPLAAELFGSRRMEYVLQELGGQGRRLMLFDSSPLLATSEAPTLAAHMGQIIVVVAAGSTRQQTLKSALQTLDSSRCINLVLNMSTLPASESYYYSYYHHYSKGH